MTPVLRPRQHQALADLRASYAAGRRAPILVAPTGFGKTATAAEIVRQSVAKGRRVWFVAHLKEILDDTAGRLTHAGISFGQIRAGRSCSLANPVQVVSVQTAVRRSGLLRPDLMIIDECHLAVARSYQQLVAALGRPALLGLTATPQRLDGRGLGEMFDDLVLTCSTAELIDEGLLAPIRLFEPPGVDLSGLSRRAGDFDQGQAGDLLSRPTVVGDALSHWKRLCAGRRGVAFCTTIAHADAVSRQWQQAGYRAMAVHGGSDDAERREAIAGLRAGRLDLVACAQLWIAGVDVPEIDAVIWLRPTWSLTTWLQGNGRGLRVAPGKADLIVLDHVGNRGRLGHPIEVHEWSLEGKAKAKRAAVLSVKVCPRCFAAVNSRAPECPECGHRFAVERRELQHVDGELVEVGRGGPPLGGFQPGDVVKHKSSGRQYVVDAVTEDGSYLTFKDGNLFDGNANSLGARSCFVLFVSRPSLRRQQGRAQTLDELIQLGRTKGMKNPRGWARHVLAARQAKGQFERVTA